MSYGIEEKTCIVTGATSGIGYETARILAAAGARIVGVGRDPARCASAEARIQEETGSSRVRFLPADLSAQAAVKGLAERIAAENARVDILVNNAGIYASRHRESMDGVELQFAVNYLCGFLLTRELLPLLEAAPASRVINVSSGSHFAGRINWKDVGMRRGYFGLKAYDQSKLALVLFTYELARRLGSGSTISTYAVDPGLVKTDIASKGGGFIVKLVWRMRTRNGKSPREAAESIAWLAASPEASGRTGQYWKEGSPLASSGASYSPEDARRLWQLSEKLCGMERWSSERKIVSRSAT